MDALLIPLFIGTCILFLVLLPALLLYAVPIRCTVASIQEEGRRESVITISWAGAGIRIARSGETSTARILAGGRSVYSIPAAEAKTRDAEPPFTGTNISRSEIARHILPAIIPFGRFAVAVFRQIRIDEISGNLRIGLGDPVATGMLYGGYWASRFSMNASRIFVVIEPVFGRRVVECDLLVRLKFRHPLVILIEAVPLARNPDVRKLVMAFRPAPSEGVKA